MPFFFLLLKRTTHSESGYCGTHKWLSEEKGMERKGGVRVQAKGAHWDSLSVIKFVETQKELQSHSQEHLEAEIGGL